MKITKNFRTEVERFWGQKSCVIALIVLEINRQFREKYHRFEWVNDFRKEIWDVPEAEIHEKLFKAGMSFESSMHSDAFIEDLAKMEI